MPLTKATQNVVEGIVSTGSTGVSAGSFQIGQQYKITSLGTTTQSQWNTIAGTTGQTYVVGSLFTAATIGSGSGNGAAAVARTLANRFADVVNVKDFGAVGDGVADDTVAIQAAINKADALGGSEVQLSAGRYVISDTLVLKNKVQLVGQGSAATEIYLANSSNVTMIKSYNYDALVGTDTWLVADGATYGYGLKRLRLYGNKANQTSGSGVKFYGKRLRVDDVIIAQCKDEGWHSESNYYIAGAQAQNGDDMPEGLIRGLYVWECDSNGITWRGQHDTLIESIFVGLCAGWGVRFETDSVAPVVYSGTADVQFAHIYANKDGGIFIDTNSTMQGGLIISESNSGVGLQCNGWQVKIDTLQLYSNNADRPSLGWIGTGNYQAILSGNECVFDKIHSKLAKPTKAHISITGSNNDVDITVIGSNTDGSAGNVAGVSITGSSNIVTAVCRGASSSGVAIDVDANATSLNANIQDYSSVGGIGLRTNYSGSKIGNRITSYLVNNNVLWNNVQTGNLNSYNILGFANVGQSMISGVGPNGTDVVEDWSVRIFDANTSKNNRSSIRKIAAMTIDLNTTVEQEITETVDEFFGFTPEPEDINFNLYYTGTNETFAVQYFKLHSVSSSQIKWRIKLSTAAGGAASAYITYGIQL
jgi:hypothetical protein